MAFLKIKTLFYLYFLLVLSINVLLSQETKKERINGDTLITIIPRNMSCIGDVAFKSNINSEFENEWLYSLPDDGVALGVDPDSCTPANWQGGTVYKEVYLPDVFHPTVYVLKVNDLSKPKSRNNELLDQTRYASIRLDTRELYKMRITKINNENNFSVPTHYSIITTIVVRKSAKHKIAFEVPAKSVWLIKSIKLKPYPFPNTLKGVCYSPYRDCQYPGGKYKESIPTLKQIQEDIFRLSHTCNAIRTYSSTGKNAMIPAIAKSFGLKVFVGAWIDGDYDDPKNDAEEIDALIKIANEIPVDGIIVGNEYLYRHKTEPSASEYLRDCVLQVKRGILNKKIPIATAECSLDRLIHKNQYNTRILDEIDGVFVHIYPFWSNCSINKATKSTFQIYKNFKRSLMEKYSDKFVIIGEAGWPSAGENNGNAKPTFENQRKYLYEFLKFSESENINFMYFDAFDELWKIEEGRRGQNWGYSYSDRSAKYDFFGVLIPPSLISKVTKTVQIPKPIYTKSKHSYSILDEWPTRGESFKLSDESLKKIKEHGVPNNLYQYLLNYRGKEFPDRSSLIKTIFKDEKSYIYEYSKSDRKLLTNPTMNDSPINNFYRTEKLVLKYSKYSYFFPRFMGDVHSITMFECDREKPAKGNLSARIKFSFEGRKKWCGIYWLPSYEFENEENLEIGWADLPGVNIYKKLGANHKIRIILTFYARGQKGGEKVQFKVGGINKHNKLIESKWITLEKKWKQYAIDLSDLDLSNIVGGFCCVSNKNKNPRRNEIQFYLDDIQYKLLDKNTPLQINSHFNILNSDFHLLQFFGDISSRSTNFFESDYHGGVLSGEIRFIFPKFSKLLKLAIPLPNPFFSGALKSLKNINWEDRFDFGLGLEWRPFIKTTIFEKPLLRWLKLLRFYTLYLHTKYLQYQEGWNWRPKSDIRYGIEFYDEHSLYNTDIFWSEIWADGSWRKTNFYVNDFESLTFAMVPKLGIKIFPKNEFCLMPYITGELAYTARNEFWQNRLVSGIGIRFMPYRWDDSMMDVFIKGLRLYIESLWTLKYFDDKAPTYIPNHDLRAGLNYTINWW